MPPPLDLLPPLLQGLKVTLLLTLGGAVVALIAAWAAGLARLAPWRFARVAALVYIEVFRGTSALVQLFWFYFALPLLGIELSAMTTGILVLGLNIGAYGAEIVRAAIQNVTRGQFEAATALNLAPWTRLRYIIVPQAIPPMLPPAGNLLVELLKSTSLVSLITLSDLTFTGQLLRAETLRSPEIFGCLLVIYFAVAFVLTRGVAALERRMSRHLRLEHSHGV